MDWKQVVQRWQALPPEEQARLRRLRIPRNVAESMAFEGEPVDLRMLEAEHARRGQPPVLSKPGLEFSPPRS
jgi:hypothetical protein